MKFAIYTSIEKFTGLVEQPLLHREAENNLLLSLLLKIKNGAIPSETCFMSAVIDNDKVLLAFLQTPSYNLIIGTTNDISEESIHFAVEKFYKLGLRFPGVIGSKPSIGLFVSKWQTVFRNTPKQVMDQGIYVLKKTNQIVQSTGSMRLANVSEIHLICGWMKDFTRVTPERLTYEQCLERALTHIAAGQIYVWDVYGEPVSMVMKTRQSQNGAVVSWVYTPMGKRGHGFATSLVHQFSNMLLKEYKFCCLYTDLNFPTSNKIYKEIGYKLVCESAIYNL
ncbi:MAG: hypothetical protein K0R71_2167 [Bacillales bacterium]|jgi:predicted GNAT family acetyltransferase|nr:hypothetical protein [Bacillales bacterium]